MALVVGDNTFITVQEALVLMGTMVGVQKFAKLPTQTQEAYLGTAYRYLISSGIKLPPSTVPPCVKEAQAEMALWDLIEGISNEASDTDLLIKKAKVGSISVEYNEPKSEGKRAALKGSTRFPPLVRKCLSVYGASFPSVGAFQGLIVRS